MLNYGKKLIFQLLCCPKKIILNETKNHNPPLQVKWLVPNLKNLNSIDQFQTICNTLVFDWSPFCQISANNDSGNS